MPDNQTLKPCVNPDCYPSNSLPYLQEDSLNGYYVVCNHCSMNGPHCATDSDARREWNALPRSSDTAPKLRPCEWREATAVDKDFNQQYEYHSGLFHGWTADGLAKVEKPDGWTVTVSGIRFTDRPAADTEREGE